jgi:pantothenate kinase
MMMIEASTTDPTTAASGKTTTTTTTQEQEGKYDVGVDRRSTTQEVEQQQPSPALDQAAAVGVSLGSTPTSAPTSDEQQTKQPATTTTTNSSTVIYTIGIAGGSGAGKSTLAKKIFESLGGADHVCYLVHDAYYKDQSDKCYEERCHTNFDHPDALETDLMLSHIQQLKNGETVPVPVYDFATHTRQPNESTLASPKPILLLEGILLLHEESLVKEMDLKVFVVS